MRSGGVIGARGLLTVLGIVVMVYPNPIIKTVGIAMFVSVFFTEKIMTRGLTLPFSRGASQ